METQMKRSNPRRLASTLLALACILSAPALTAVAAAEPPGIPEVDAINAVSNPAQLKPGNTAAIDISVHFTNLVGDIGEYNNKPDAEKAHVRVTGFSPSELYLNDANLLRPQPLGTINATGSLAGWSTVRYPVTLNSLYSGASVSLTVEVRYENGLEADGIITQTFSFAVDNRQPESIPDPPQLPDPVTASVSVTPATVTIRAGRSNTIQFGVVNNGERAANNLTATLTPTGELQSILNSNPQSAFTASLSDLRRAGSANQGNRGSFSYNIAAPDNLRSGVYEMKITGSFFHETTNMLGTFEGVLQVIVVSDFEPASMQITDVGPLYAVRPGELFNVNIRVHNTGGLAANEAFLSVKNPSETTFTVMGSTAAGMIGTVGAGQTGARTLTLRASQTVPAGVYPLVFVLNYTDSDDRQQTTEFEAAIEVLGTPSAEIEFIRATVPSGTLTPGQRAVMTIELRNSSSTDAGNVRVRVSGFSGTGMYLVNSESNLPTKTIELIPAGERATVSYDVVVSSACNMPGLALQAEIMHTLPDGETSSITENISFAVILPDLNETPPSISPTSTPKLIIDHYAMTWEGESIQTLRAGAMFDLTFTLRNTSALTALSNITVVLSSTDGIFMPAAGSNTFFIESVDAEGEIERTIRLIVAQNAETKSYQLTFNLDYEDKEGAAYRPSETLSLPVIVPLVVELANFNAPMYGDMGMQTYMMFQYINKGKGIVYNFTIDIEGDFMIPDGASNYIGNLPSGYMDFFECMMIPIMPGDIQGAVVLRFEDAVGNVTEMREEFVMTVNEPYYPDIDFEFPGGDIWDPGYEEGGGGVLFGLSWPILIGIGAGVIAILVVTLVLVRRKKVKQRKLLEEDDYEDE